MSIVSDYNISIVSLFGDIVNSIRKSGVITAMSPPTVDNYITLTTDNDLSENDVVTIESVDYIAFNVTPTQFTIQDGVGFAGGTWQAKAPYYIHGHMLDIANRLTKLDNATQLHSFQKYPLIVLVQDFPEQRSKVKNIEVKLRILIINKTQRELTSEERYSANFIPILYPLYGRLLQALKASKVFAGTMQHTKTDRLFWGTQMAQYNEKNILNDYIDAIELTDFELNILSTC